MSMGLLQHLNAELHQARLCYAHLNHRGKNANETHPALDRHPLSWPVFGR